MDRYLEANRRLWDERTGIHLRSAFYDVEGFKTGGLRVRPYEIAEVGDVTEKRLLHLQCHFGLDTLSWARLGADVTGVDFSERAVEAARGLAAEVGLRARFIVSDVLDLPRVLDGQFDIVYTSRGVLWWLPDLGRWAQVVARFVRRGGIFYIAESHPCAHVFDDGPDVRGLDVHYPYFERRQPLACAVEGSYADRDAPVSEPIAYGWSHSLGEIVTSLASAGLRIDFLHEFPFVGWQMFPFLVRDDQGDWRLPHDSAGEVPLSFSLRASK